MYDKHQIDALKKADVICFDYDGEESRIRAILRPGDDWTREYAVPLEVEETRIDNYSSDGRPIRSAFHHLGSVKYDGVARTWIKFVRADSRLMVRWVRDNNSPVIEAAGLVRDEVYLTIQNGSTARSFLIGVQVGLDNTARMTRV